MTTEFIGTLMPTTWHWGREEKKIIQCITQQINSAWPDQHNLLINLTWFGPTFDHQNGNWSKVQQLIKQQTHFDQVFFVSSVDPVFIPASLIQELETGLNANSVHWMGNIQTKFEFNFFAMICGQSFQEYSESEILLQDPQYVFLNYNRKPRAHRVDFVKKLLESGLSNRGVFTLGKDPDRIFNKEQDQMYFGLGEKDADYRSATNDQINNPFALPDDVLSLHRIDIWQHHFLNVIGATEFFPWDPIFVSETQWKPIIGLRPFVINGNTNTYQWLRSHGFRTFESWLPVDVEVNEVEVHDRIIDVIRHFSQMSSGQIQQIYQDMLPDLRYNRERFFEFAQEQEYKINHLFV